MYHQPELTDLEWEMVLDLLENEKRNLPPEIRRTHERHYHQELQERLKRIDDLIVRIRAAIQVTA